MAIFIKKAYPAATVNVVGPKSHVMLKRRVEWVMIRRLSCTVSDADILGSKEPKLFCRDKIAVKFYGYIFDASFEVLSELSSGHICTI